MPGFTDVDFTNAVMIHVGQGRVLSSSDQRKAVQVIESRKDQIRQAFLEEHTWRPAIVRASVASDAAAPAFGYSDRFPLPADCLRVFGLFDPDDYAENYSTTAEPWKVEGAYILANTGGATDPDTLVFTPGADLQFFYISDLSDPATWSGLFFEALALYVAQAVVYAITGRTDLVNAIEPLKQQMITKARRINAIIGQPEVIRDEGYLNSMWNYPSGRRFGVGW